MGKAKTTPCAVPHCPNEVEAGNICDLHWKDPKTARYLAEAEFAGINEYEAIAYARGIAKGLAMAGVKGSEAEIIMFAEKLSDKMLNAGATFMGINMFEEVVAELKGGGVVNG